MERRSLNQFSEVDYQLIKHWLEFGDIIKLSNAHKLSRQTVSKVLNGKSKYYNMKILMDAMNLALKNRDTIMNKMKQLKDLK